MAKRQDIGKKAEDTKHRTKIRALWAHSSLRPLSWALPAPRLPRDRQFAYEVPELRNTNTRCDWSPTAKSGTGPSPVAPGGAIRGHRAPRSQAAT